MDPGRWITAACHHPGFVVIKICAISSTHFALLDITFPNGINDNGTIFTQIIFQVRSIKDSLLRNRERLKS